MAKIGDQVSMGGAIGRIIGYDIASELVDVEWSDSTINLGLSPFGSNITRNIPLETLLNRTSHDIEVDGL